MTELIAKKRDGAALSREEIDFMIEGYTRGDIPDYQMSAMLMAMYTAQWNIECRVLVWRSWCLPVRMDSAAARPLWSLRAPV